MDSRKDRAKVRWSLWILLLLIGRNNEHLHILAHRLLGTPERPPRSITLDALRAFALRQYIHSLQGRNRNSTNDTEYSHLRNMAKICPLCLYRSVARPRCVAAHGKAAGVPRRAQPGGGRFRRTGRGAVPRLPRGGPHESDCGLRPRLPLALPCAVSRGVRQLPYVSRGHAVEQRGHLTKQSARHFAAPVTHIVRIVISIPSD